MSDRVYSFSSFQFPNGDPGGFGWPVYLSGACPPGSLVVLTLIAAAAESFKTR
jgi:hypothetical protein